MSVVLSVVLISSVHILIPMRDRKRETHKSGGVLRWCFDIPLGAMYVLGTGGRSDVGVFPVTGLDG